MTSSGSSPHPPAAHLLEGRRALVTGATSGIGQAVAGEPAANGAAVAVGYRSDPGAAREMTGAVTGRAVVDVDPTGAFLCSREAAGGMIAAGGGGVIVAVTSVHDRMPWAGFSHYSAFTESIAKELAPHGIRVVAVAPGAIATPINREMLENPAARRAVERRIPMGRVGESAELARAAAWLAPDGRRTSPARRSSWTAA